jgi:hypothetical protein
MIDLQVHQSKRWFVESLWEQMIVLQNTVSKEFDSADLFELIDQYKITLKDILAKILKTNDAPKDFKT